MMLEQSLISPNFLGKESFRWFIGVTTKYKQVENGGYKAKVRIIGYHPDATSIIKDEELPWAHVLVPLNMGAGEGGTGASFNSRGSETVVGFFMDGDNGQQPVIIGSLFSGYDIVHSNSFEQGTNGFKPFKPEKSSIKNPNNTSSETGKSSASGIPNTLNNVGISSANPKGVASQGKLACDIGDRNKYVITIPPVCKDSKTNYSKMIKTLRDFIKTLRTIQQVQSGFISPTLNALQDVPGLVQETSTVISDLVIEYMKFKRDAIIADINKWLKEQINQFLPKDFKLFQQLAADKIVDNIWCVFNKVIQKVGEFIFNFLTQLVGAVTNVPICAAEAFLGSIMSTITNEVSEALGPTLEEISSQIGNVLGPISNYVSQALTYSTQALAFLSCESAECKQIYDYQMNKGYIPQETLDDYSKILGYPRSKLSEGKEAAKKWLGITGAGRGDNPYSYLSATYGYCDAINLECGLPTVKFFGGAGGETLGLAVVDALGQMMGIYVQNAGTGYASAPYVSIEDPCENGTGAVATANIEDGKVVSVTMNNTGSGYLGPQVTGEDVCSINPIDSSGSSVVGFIVGVNILNTGVGYATTDLITDSVCAGDVEIYPITDSNGRIVDVKIVNPGSAIRIYPRLVINTQDGEGAILEPILNFKPVEKPSVENDMNKVKKVVLCAEDHV
jgi:hypothetical protein